MANDLFDRSRCSNESDRCSNERIIEDSLRLVAIFMKLKDEKARAEILRLAERCAWFDARPGLCDFSSSMIVPSNGAGESGQASVTSTCGGES